ncbi:hypothetical protein [uncultured Tolumonas sp.]|uniref:hypothetical protein n=1 Tax=uncultured Tolumonas sp. TaxID=263765 RepID=UPI00292E552E|nr:hypothetical protein [uncultured Tolumonas sp.]
MGQVNRMAFALAELQSCLDVYKGLFQEKEDADILFLEFREIGAALKKSLSTNLIIGCAALFTDPEKSFGSENMSFNNLYARYENKLAPDTNALRDNINKNLQLMNLKLFRNKLVGHFDLDAKLGKKLVDGYITTQALEDLIIDGQKMLNMIIRDAELRPTGNRLAFYTPISESRSVKHFLQRITKN